MSSGMSSAVIRRLRAVNMADSQGEEASKCPVNHEAREVWLKQGDVGRETCPVDHGAGSVELPEEREVSSIPRTGTGAHWVYPSEKQFFEAMLRKKWDPNSSDMKTVVPLHNSVNERVWSCIGLWEKGQGGDACGGIQLTSFKGNAKKLTPRAWFRSAVLGYSKPFDRHDWTVDRCGKAVDYVIDFYHEDSEARGPNVYLDVRPKLNSLEGVRLRVCKALGL
ncbi:hypothetical protein HG537_0D06260 [Torulaspora globosa]|uniref:Holocytochrome c-type synthase n=1 Tax=Torulaspora globosa TaxID=48254 RepID=A0A7H9HVY9_9SACH|nr:hypothetical protein HG537_0D06260 [Torulaspora sp. CBS 2947]